MIVYRLSRAPYANDLSGVGAYTYGGRWNSKGVRMVYASESRALAALEVAVHIPLGVKPLDYKLIEIEIVPIPEQVYIPRALPADWNAVPPTDSAKKIGDGFVAENKLLLMKVPSAIVPGEYNVLINPKHPDMKNVRIKRVIDFVFDQRLMKNI